MDSTTRFAAHVMTDDWFRMGGTLYRVVEVEPNDIGDTIITFYNPETKSLGIFTLVYSPNTPFKIYNQ